MAGPFTLRSATPGDAARIAHRGRRTFTETFAASNTAEDLRLFLDSTYSEAIQAAELADPAAAHLLVEVPGEAGNEAIGFARLRRGEVPDCVPGPEPLELQRIYVLRAWLGLKAGPALLECCLDEARARGAQTLWLGVWERNDRARAFYRRYGFVEVGDHVFVVGTDPQRDVILARAL